LKITKRSLLLHICCAPDATVPIQTLKDEAWEEVAGYFYGSNIHPEDEYLRRADAVKFLSCREGVAVYMRPYNPDEWFSEASNETLQREPEGGARCAVCFALQLRAAADEAKRLGASHLCTTLTISPHKDAALISRLGGEIATALGLTWENRIWRKNNGFSRSARISRELQLYRQNYCGCGYSAYFTRLSGFTR